MIAWFLCAACLPGCAPLPAVSSALPASVVVAVPAGVESEALLAAAELYRQETGRVVSVQSRSLDAYQENLEAALLAGRSDIDLAYMPASRLARWVSYHALQAVADLTSPSGDSAMMDNVQTQQLLRPWLANLTYSDKVYGFPTQPAVEALWYRADLLRAAGLQPPATWDEFNAAALALSQAPERYGVALAAGEGSVGFEFAALLAGFGGQFYTTAAGDPPAVRLALGQPPLQQALAYYAGFWRAPWRAVPEGLTAGREAAAAALLEGRAAMAILPLTLAAPLLDCQASPQACSAPESGPAEPLLAFAPLPGLAQGVAMGELSAWVIPLHAAHAQAAREFGAWLSGPAGARAWALNGGIPAASGDLVNEPALVEQAPYLALLAGVQEYRLPIPPVTSAEQVEGVLRAGVQAAAAGRLQPAEAAADMADGLRRALHMGGYIVE